MPNVKNNAVNIYGFPYNAPGFELPYIYKTFKYLVGDRKELVDDIIKKQMELTYCNEKEGFYKNTEDSNTLEARIYEYVRALM